MERRGRKERPLGNQTRAGQFNQAKNRTVIYENIYFTAHPSRATKKESDSQKLPQLFCLSRDRHGCYNSATDVPTRAAQKQDPGFSGVLFFGIAPIPSPLFPRAVLVLYSSAPIDSLDSRAVPASPSLILRSGDRSHTTSGRTPPAPTLSTRPSTLSS